MAPSHPRKTSPPLSSNHLATLHYDAVLFDMDGVVTRTTSVHAAAWKERFDSALADSRSGVGADTPPFDADRATGFTWTDAAAKTASAPS